MTSEYHVARARHSPSELRSVLDHMPNVGFSTLGQDMTFALRLLRRSPAFTAAATLTIALAVGVNTSVFSVVNAFIFRPLPVRDGDRLAVIATHRPATHTLAGVSYPDLQEYRSATPDIFEDIAGYSVGFLGLRPEGGRADRVLVTWVTGNYFSVLDVRPELGRLIRTDEGVPRRAATVVVLGYSSWQRRFGGDPSVVGKMATVNGTRCTIVGVVPRTFTGTQALSESEIYLPLNWTGSSTLDDRGGRWLHAFGRLRPGVSTDTAHAAMNAIAQRLAREHPETNAGVAVTVVPERFARPIEDAARSNALIATIMLGLVTLVLIVGAVNVTNLLLARGFDRRKELAVRAALGASRFRLMRQLTIESLVLAAVGGSAGLLLASWSTRALASIRVPGDLPVRLDFHLDLRVLGYAAAVILVTGVGVGLLPALRATRLDIDRVLRQPARGSGTRTRYGLRSVLVIAEIAAALALLVTTGLFVRSLQRAERVDFGFAADNVFNVHMDVGQLGYTESKGRAFFDEVERRAHRIPGVEDVGYAFTAPLGYIRLGSTVDAEGRIAGAAERVSAGFNIVSPAYFRTMEIPILSGRPFIDDDDERSRPVAIVNRRLAERLWPGVDPVGRRFSTSGPDGPWIHIVGVTSTGKYHFLFEDPLPYFYLPAAQHYSSLRVLHLRTSVAPESLRRPIESVIQQLEPELPLYDVQSMRSALGGGYGLFLVRAGALAATIFGALGLALALIGVYGVMAYAAAQRSYEVGVRMALGAAPRDIVRLLLRDGITLVLAGSCIGLAAAAGVSHAMRTLLFGISALDVWAFGIAMPFIACAALIGCGVPAWRTSRSDPMRTLRL